MFDVALVSFVTVVDTSGVLCSRSISCCYYCHCCLSCCYYCCFSGVDAVVVVDAVAGVSYAVEVSVFSCCCSYYVAIVVSDGGAFPDMAFVVVVVTVAAVLASMCCC